MTGFVKGVILAPFSSHNTKANLRMDPFNLFDATISEHHHACVTEENDSRFDLFFWLKEKKYERKLIEEPLLGTEIFFLGGAL